MLAKARRCPEMHKAFFVPKVGSFATRTYPEKCLQDIFRSAETVSWRNVFVVRNAADCV